MSEKMGERSVFQIECVHEPLENEKSWVFGRMCLRFGDDVLGDFDEPACMLDVTYGHVEYALETLAGPGEPVLFLLSDDQLWKRLDAALYKDNDRTPDRVVADARRYRRFDFLTNGGESFDKFKSFIVPSEEDVRVLFMRHDQPLIAKKVPRSAFVPTLQAWLEWFNVERARLQVAAKQP